MKFLWFISIILIGLSTIVVLGNLWIAVAWYVFKRRASFIPFVGGILGAIGLLTIPMANLRHLWWLPLVVDIGCAPMLLGVIIDKVKRLNHPKK